MHALVNVTKAVTVHAGLVCL